MNIVKFCNHCLSMPMNIVKFCDHRLRMPMNIVKFCNHCLRMPMNIVKFCNHCLRMPMHIVKFCNHCLRMPYILLNKSTTFELLSLPFISTIWYNTKNLSSKTMLENGTNARSCLHNVEFDSKLRLPISNMLESLEYKLHHFTVLLKRRTIQKTYHISSISISLHIQ